TGEKKKPKTVRDKLGLVAAIDGESAITYDAAVRAYAEARAASKSAETLGPGGVTRSRFTVGEAFSKYDLVKSLNRATTKQKDAEVFERYFGHLKDRFLDELTTEFWLRFIQQLKDGTLVVGYRVGIGGEQVAETRGPLKSATIKGVMNIAVLLYD